jgi:hypothetical protein
MIVRLVQQPSIYQRVRLCANLLWFDLVEQVLRLRVKLYGERPHRLAAVRQKCEWPRVLRAL